MYIYIYAYTYIHTYIRIIHTYIAPTYTLPHIYMSTYGHKQRSLKQTLDRIIHSKPHVP